MLGLLEIYSQKRADFKDPKLKNKLIWEKIGEEMKRMGFLGCNAKACETKFKNLKRAYITYVDHNNTSVNNPKCAFYAEMHELFHKDDAVSPVIL